MNDSAELRPSLDDAPELVARPARTHGAVLRLAQDDDHLAPPAEAAVAIPDLRLPLEAGALESDLHATIRIELARPMQAEWIDSAGAQINSQLEGRLGIAGLQRHLVTCRFNVLADSPATREMIDRFGRAIIAHLHIGGNVASVTTDVRTLGYSQRRHLELVD